MLELASLILVRARTFGARAFHRFGIHCATHQIRIILVSCVVITSLFYPALAIYSSSQPHVVSDSTSRLLDTFLAASSVSGFYAQHDLCNLWGGHSALRIRDDAVSRTRCRMERTVRIERILIQSPLTDDVGALNQQNLVSTLHLEQRLSNLLLSHNTPCLKQDDGRCFVVSPLAFWDHDENAVLSDLNILDTLSVSNNVSVAGIHITPHMVLAGRGRSEHVASVFDFAQFLALSYFFPEKDCLSKSEHVAWLKLLEEATQGDELVTEAQEPTLIALEYLPNPSKNKGFSGISAFLYIAYSAFFAYVTWSMRRMVAVHSRIGLTFTALIEIAVSTITSLSVCALVGFKVTMVPWELLPIVIVFVGAENMFNLVDAVSKTSVTLPVKLRIAEGLSRAGTSNTLKVVCYNSILGVIAFFAEGAIRQFCAFAVVVLVAHWFLAHTFFMAVLSIDIQRLELEELLRQNSSLASSVPAVPHDSSAPRPLTGWRKLIVTAQSLLGGRATKNISLFLLLAITATLYFTTYPASTHIKENIGKPLPRGALRSGPNKGGLDQQSPAWHIWKLLNPKEDPLLHLRVEMPTILTFRPDAQMEQSLEHKRRFWFRTLLPFFWKLNIVVLPITATTLALYGLLLYLLKDADLLEAQRNRAEPDCPTSEVKSTLEGRIIFTTLPRAFSSDVEHMASSKNGGVVVCVGLQNEVAIWRINGQTRSYVAIDVTDLLLRAASTSSAASAITAVAVDDAGEFCAVGTGGGVIGVWSIRNDSVTPLSHLVPENGSSGVLELAFIAPIQKSTTQSTPSSPSSFKAQTNILVICNNNTAANWAVSALPTVTHVVPSRSSRITKVKSLRVEGDEGLLVAFCLQDGSLEIVEVVDLEPHLLPDYCIQAGNPSDLVAKVHACKVDVAGSRRTIIGAATDAGVVSLWDGATAECISILDEIYGTLDTLRLSAVQSKKCRYCGDLPLESFSIALSIRHVILFYKAFIPLQDRRCSCAHNQVRQPREVFVGRRSRSNSTASAAQPSYSRSRLCVFPNNASVIDPSPFPVSGHGVHSRRTSMRSETLCVPPVTNELEPLGPLDTSTSVVISSTPRSSIWQNVVVARTGDVIGSERGCWEVAGTRIVGVRRKPRSNGLGNGKEAATHHSTASSGLTNATLERWELWLYDTSSSHVQSSPLAALLDTSIHPSSHRPSHSRRPSDGVPRLPFTRVSPIINTRSYGLAGFGNTIGLFHYALP